MKIIVSDEKEKSIDQLDNIEINTAKNNVHLYTFKNYRKRTNHTLVLLTLIFYNTSYTVLINLLS